MLKKKGAVFISNILEVDGVLKCSSMVLNFHTIRSQFRITGMHNLGMTFYIAFQIIQCILQIFVNAVLLSHLIKRLRKLRLTLGYPSYSFDVLGVKFQPWDLLQICFWNMKGVPHGYNWYWSSMFPLYIVYELMLSVVVKALFLLLLFLGCRA